MSQCRWLSSFHFITSRNMPFLIFLNCICNSYKNSASLTVSQQISRRNINTIARKTIQKTCSYWNRKMNMKIENSEYSSSYRGDGSEKKAFGEKPSQFFLVTIVNQLQICERLDTQSYDWRHGNNVVTHDLIRRLFNLFVITRVNFFVV